MGDSKTPMIFIAAACFANIVLDYYFMGFLGLGPVGAALGTTLSQALSVVLSLAVILTRRSMGLSLHRGDFRRKPFCSVFCASVCALSCKTVLCRSRF